MYGLKFIAVHKTFTTEEADRDSVAPVAWELSLATRTVGRTDKCSKHFSSEVISFNYRTPEAAWKYLVAPWMTSEVTPRTEETAGRAYVMVFKDS